MPEILMPAKGSFAAEKPVTYHHAEEFSAMSEPVVKKHPLKSSSGGGVPTGRRRSERAKKDPTSPTTKERNTPQQQQSASLSNEEEAELDELLGELRGELEVKRLEEERLQREITELLAATTGRSPSGGNGGVDESRAFNLAATRLNNSLLLVEGDTQQLASSLKAISKLADSISGKVSELDVAKTRVVECLQLAGDMRDLGTCSEGVEDAIRSEDWSTAAELVHRFLTLDQAVFQLRDAVGTAAAATAASEEQNSGQSVRSSYDIMERASARLREEFGKRMDEAVKTANVPDMQRYLKLFPLINDHATGLEKFAVYLRAEIDRIGKEHIKIMNAGGTDDGRAMVLYADTLYLFFDALAALLDLHHAVIENSYGPERLLDLVTRIQGSVDEVVVRIIGTFKSRRRFGEAIDGARRGVGGGAGKSSASSSQNGEKSAGGAIADGRPDALSIDVVLTEVTQMSARTEMYWRFLKKKIVAKAGLDKKAAAAAEQERNASEYDDNPAAVEERKKAEVARAEERSLKLHNLLHDSQVGRRIQELRSSYVVLEQFYMEAMVAKAIEMDTREEKGQTWPSSSVVDDTVFLLRKTARRALSTASPDATCAVVNNAVALLDTTFFDALATPIKAGYPSTPLFTADMLASVGGVVPSAGGGSNAKLAEQREAYLCTVNNARVAAELTRQLRTSLLQEASAGDSNRSEVERGKLTHAFSQLDDVARRLEQLAAKGVASLAQSVVKPAVKNSCESYADDSHCLSESQLAEAESVDPFIESFCASVDRLLQPFERSLAPDNYQELLLLACAEVARCMERAALQATFNRLGALQLDREVRHLLAFLSDLAGFAAREKCARLSQIVCVLNVDCVDEAREVWQSGGGAAKALAIDEVKKILSRRSDLPKSQVQQLEM